jgi:signal transduction histidine kinase
LDQASAVIDDVCAGLVNQTRPEAVSRLSRDIGASRAAARVHPAESLRAASALFGAVLCEVMQWAAGHPEATDLVGRAAVVLHDSVIGRIREGAAAYASFLLHEIHEAQVLERRRVARELHDRVGSTISAALRNLELYRMLVESDPTRAELRLGLAERAVGEALESVREVAADLRVHPNGSSLEKALRDYVETVGRNDVTVNVEINGDEGWIPVEVLDQVFFVVREALRNAFGHARADAIRARVDIAPRLLRASIEDDGLGFDADGESAKSSGLASMRERVALIGGRIHIASWPGRGSLVEIVVPLSGETHATG